MSDNSAFEVAFMTTVQVEGGFSNDPVDRGGKTMFGITEAVARANGYLGAMEHMVPEDAKRIYKSQFWDVLRLDQVAVLSKLVAYELFDTAVNCGIEVAGKFLQRALNALNRNATDYADMPVDGLIGPMTIAAFDKFFNVRGPAGLTVILRALNALQCVRYMEIAEAKPAQERFVYGWILNRVQEA